MLPDITSDETSEINSRIDRVGMRNVEMPVTLKGITVPATMDAMVSLDDPKAKGIHMSRLYLALQDHLEQQVLSPAQVFETLNFMSSSQSNLSKTSYLNIRFELPLKRPALKSQYSGYRYYPIHIEAVQGPEHSRLDVSIALQYSSTCPCSAALSRQLVQERFDERFQGEMIQKADVHTWLGTVDSMAATPHSQRSVADLDLRYAADNPAAFDWEHVINAVESSLKTPVQTAVKREDEQDFARLNGENLMFCEDAVKKIKRAVDADASILDYRVSSTHLESLHAHDAVAVLCKGVPGGFTA